MVRIHWLDEVCDKKVGTCTFECIVENLFIFEFPGPVIVGAYLGISTSYALFELGTNIPPVVDAIA